MDAIGRPGFAIPTSVPLMDALERIGLFTDEVAWVDARGLIWWRHASPTRYAGGLCGGVYM